MWLIYTRLAPFASYRMSIAEHSLEFWLDQKVCSDLANDPQWWFVLDIVFEQAALGMGLDDVLMPPAIERARDLNILKHMWRVIGCVLSDPSGTPDAKDVCIDDSLGPDHRYIGLSDDGCVLPRRHQYLDSVRLFVKIEDEFGRGPDDTFFCKSH
jgi:hypothetical protein